MNRLLAKNLLLLKDGQYRQIHEWSLGWDLVQTTNNGSPTWMSAGSYGLSQEYFRDSTVVEHGLRFVEPDSGLYFESLDAACHFYRERMRNPVIEMVEAS